MGFCGIFLLAGDTQMIVRRCCHYSSSRVLQSQGIGRFDHYNQSENRPFFKLPRFQMCAIFRTLSRREAPPSQPTCSSGALWSVGCEGGAKTRMSSVITQNKCAQNIGHYLPYQLYLLFYSWANVTARHFPGCPPSTQYQPITIP